MCGVGGSTIEQAKLNMSYDEFLKWVAYRNKRGSFTMTSHLERGFAMLTKIYIDAHSKRGAQPIPLWRLMPHADEPELTLDDAMRDWR